MNQHRDNKTTYLLIAGAAFVVVALGAVGYFAKNYYDLRAHPNKAAEEQTKQLTEAVGKLYQLPSDEKPIVGKVQDQAKLKEQPFFAKTQNGDDILIYQKAKVALVYRAKTNKLINVGPIAIDATPKAGESAASVKVLNGTTKPNAVDSTKDALNKIAGITVDQNTSDAKNKTVKQTIVVDVKGDKGELVKQIASNINAKVGSLPAGEPAPDSDIVVIVGG